MSRRNDHTHNEIKSMAIQAGIEIIKNESFVNFSARKVAKNIGYTVGTIYNVFDNHNNLILHINAVTLIDLHSQMLEQLCNYKCDNTSISKQQSIELKCKMFASTYINYAKQNLNTWRTLFEFTTSESEVLPDWYVEHIDRLFTTISIPLLDAFSEEIAQNHAKILWAGVHGICQLALTGKLIGIAPEATQEFSNKLVENYLRGLSIKLD